MTKEEYDELISAIQWYCEYWQVDDALMVKWIEAVQKP